MESHRSIAKTLITIITCAYGLVTNAQKVVEKYDLPLVLEETSGLTMLNDTLWTHNDSGNEAALYALSTKGKIIAKKKLYGHKILTGKTSLQQMENL